MSKIGVGILGLGGRGVSLGQAFGAHPDCHLVGVCDLVPERVEENLRLFEGAFGTTSIDEFLQLPGLDAVVICTPDHAHAENAVAALKARKHIYLEKPMAQTIEDCDRIIDAWNGSEAVLMVGLELRYCTLMQDMKKLVSDGEVGEIKTGTVIDNVSVGGNYYYHGSRRRKEYIISLILEKGTHSLDLANWLLDASPRRVYSSAGLDVFGGNEANDKRCFDCPKKVDCAYFIDAKGFTMDYGAVIKPTDLCVYARECDVDDNGLVIIDYDNGARICYMECHFTPEYSREFMFVGTKGKITGFYNNEQEFKITVQKRHRRKIDVYLPQRTSGSHGGGDDAIIEEFLACVKTGVPALPGVWGARDSAAIAIAAAESAQTGLPVAIPAVNMPVKTQR